MTLTVKIEGMTCNHCVMRVKKALEALPGAGTVSVSLENAEAVIDGENLDQAAIRAAVDDAGYEVKEIA